MYYFKNYVFFEIKFFWIFVCKYLLRVFFVMGVDIVCFGEVNGVSCDC